MKPQSTDHVLSAALVFEDGAVFEGESFGAPIPAWDQLKKKTPKWSGDRGYGEIVFNTSMTGYQEILTDPSYFGQIVCMTVPHVGNTGINSEDPESRKIWCAAFVVSDLCTIPSNWRSRQSLNDYLVEAGVPGLFGVDTRKLTLKIRGEGALRGMLVRKADLGRAQEFISCIPEFEGRDLIREVTTANPYPWESKTPRKFRVAVIDFGVKWNLLHELRDRGCALQVFPATTTASELLNQKFDGVFLSNGPGDPAAAPYAVKMVRDILGKLPIFGVCMGHQILGLALDGRTYKMPFGHRGGNQPVLELESGHVEISSHNHGYALVEDSLPSGVMITHRNLNDHTIEGIAAPQMRAFSVQYHPEACPGPHDSRALFDRFIHVMEGSSKL